MTQIACLPLTQRPDDIEPLFRHSLCKACQRLNHPVPEVGKEMLKEMMRRMCPNNVRELANAAELFTVGVLPVSYTHLDVYKRQFVYHVLAQVVTMLHLTR